MSADPRFSRGDRIANFAARAGIGRLTQFYDVMDGRPTLLLCGIGGGIDPPAEVTTVSVSGDGAGPGTAFRDPSGRLAQTLGRGAYLLDPNGRVMSAHAGADVEAWLAEALAGLPPAAAPAVRRGGVAPVLIVPDVLDAGTRAALIAACEADNEPSGMPRAVDGEVRMVADGSAKARRDHHLTGALAETVTALIGRRLLPEIHKAFAFRATRFEAFKVVRYDAGAGWFRPHRDNTTPDAAHRAFAMTLNLNEGYEGGALRFPEYGPDLYKPPPGAAIVFSGSHLHEATDVTEGARYALLTFLWGEEQARARVQRAVG